MATVEKVTVTDTNPAFYCGESFRGRERADAHVTIEVACSAAEARRLLDRLRAGMEVDVDGERGLPSGAPALPPGPIDAEFLNDEEPSRQNFRRDRRA